MMCVCGQVRDAMVEMDSSGDGEVDFDEFYAWFKKNPTGGMGALGSLFSSADKDERPALATLAHNAMRNTAGCRTVVR